MFSRVLTSAGVLSTVTVLTLTAAGTAAAQTSTTPVTTAAGASGPFAGLATTTTGNPFAGMGGTTATSMQPMTTGSSETTTATGTTTTVGKEQTCPAVQILAVQGTGESSEQSSMTADSGMLGHLVTPVLAKTNTDGQDVVARAYVPYAADFGFKGIPYAQSMTEGLDNLISMSTSIHQACPNTRFIVAGYSQGADVADQFVRKIGQGQGPFPADLLAAGLLFSSPTREAGAKVLPGTDKTTPDPVPGTKGEAVSKVSMGDQPAPAGGGISPTAKTSGELGAVTGRVASFCVSGDLACDTPEGAPIARVVANIAGQANLTDPVAALTSVGTALATTAVKTTASVVNQDVSGDRIDTLDYSPQKSISQRLAEASDPR